MRKLLVALPAALFLLQACNDPGADSCGGTGSTPVIPQAGATCNGATVQPGTTLTVTVKPDCQSCADINPRCNISLLGPGQVQLDTLVQLCDSNCGVGACSFGAISCSYAVPATANGTLDIVYLLGGSNGTATVTLGSAGAVTTCSI